MEAIKRIGRIGCGVLLTAALTAGTAIAQQSGVPTYLTLQSAVGSSAANVILPQKPTSQARVVSVVAQSDLASSVVKFYSGTTARSVAVLDTNISDTIMILDATNGLAASSLLYVQGATSNVVATLSSFTTTNIWSGVGTITNTFGYVVLTAGLGIAQAVNAEVEVLTTTPVTFSLGAKTNQVWASDGLYVGNYGRAAYVTVSGTANCQLNAVTVHYDALSQ